MVRAGNDSTFVEGRLKHATALVGHLESSEVHCRDTEH